MKKLKYILLAALSMAFYTSSAQKSKLIDQDKRVLAIRDSVVRKLGSENEFDRKRKATFQHYGSIYITKELELFGEDLLLIRFGTTSPHGRHYWGLLKKGNPFLFHYAANDQESHTDLLNYLNDYDSNIKNVILGYLKLYAQNDYQSAKLEAPTDNR